MTPYERYLAEKERLGERRGEPKRRPDVIGKGWAWPIRTSPAGQIAANEGIDHLEQSMYLILATPRGSRLRHPEFGSRLPELIHRSQAGAANPGVIAYAVQEALEVWEPRIDVLNVRVLPPTSPGEIRVEVEYRVRATGDVRNRVFPFVQQEGGFLAASNTTES